MGRQWHQYANAACSRHSYASTPLTSTVQLAFPMPNQKCESIECSISEKYQKWFWQKCASQPFISFTTTIISFSATTAATHSLQVGEFRLSCTVWFGAGLLCRRLSAGWRLSTEISAIRWATCLLCAMSEQHVRQSILRGGWAACMEWAAVQSTRHCSIVDCLQCTFENPFIFHLVWGHGAFVIFMISLRRI